VSLKAAVLAETKTQGPKCVVAQIRPGLSKKDADELDEVLASDAQHSAIARAMTSEYGRRVSDGAVSKHRAGICSCGPR
jgi:hypothetical protein